MDKLKPCPLCGGTNISIDEEHNGGIWGCGIGCLNIVCDQGLFIRYGLTRERAREKAIKEWNRRAGDV